MLVKSVICSMTLDCLSGIALFCSCSSRAACSSFERCGRCIIELLASMRFQIQWHGATKLGAIMHGSTTMVVR